MACLFSWRALPDEGTLLAVVSRPDSPRREPLVPELARRRLLGVLLCQFRLLLELPRQAAHFIRERTTAATSAAVAAAAAAAAAAAIAEFWFFALLVEDALVLQYRIRRCGRTSYW